MTDKSYRLFGELAHRYDLHTPPGHYLPKYEFVLDELRRYGAGAQVLDLGCGTGALLESLRCAGLAGRGIDISPEMVAVAEQRLGPGVVRVGRLQDLEERETCDAIVSMAFAFNYCADVAEARQALAGFHRALRPGGLVILQVAHAPNCPDHLFEEWEPGPGGERDVQFLCRFLPVPGEVPAVRAQYVYSCRSLKELLAEEHVLNVADVYLIAGLLRDTGFCEVRIYDNSRREPLLNALAPYVLGVRRIL
ncbi:MAG TPA: class I SAM-dependent methyltransferase [Thermoanaerobaculia bacterium]|jgi:SAM-dependent methyltransferase|nr:class I SAM-dependent methyltransferase [Thermoanaerobaculia bacterium]